MIKIPPSTRKTFELIKTMLGITDYRIKLSVSEEPNNNSAYAGYCRTLQSGWLAEVEVKSDLEGLELLETLIHEAIHIALAAQDSAFQSHILPFIKDVKQREQAADIYESYTEESVERIARALSAFVSKKGVIDVEELKVNPKNHRPRGAREAVSEPEGISPPSSVRKSRNGRRLHR